MPASLLARRRAPTGAVVPIMTKPFDDATFDTIRTMGQGGMDVMLKSVGTVSKAAQTMGIEWADFAKQSLGEGTAAMQALAKAQTPQAAMEIQADYLKGSYERLVAQTKLMSELYQNLAKDIAKPLESLVPGKMPVPA